MSTISVIDNEYASLSFDTDMKFVYHCFHSQLDSTNLRAVLNGGIDLLKKYNATKWLSDNREIGPHSEEDTLWINDHWLPAAVAAGWKYWALVVPNSFVARVNMSEFVDSFYAKGIRIMVFTNYDEAWNWLGRVDAR